MNSFPELQLDDRPGPAPRLSAEAEQRMVQAVLEGARSGSPVPVRRTRWAPWAVAAAVLLAATGALAAASVAVRLWSPPVRSTVAPPRLHGLRDGPVDGPLDRTPTEPEPELGPTEPPRQGDAAPTDAPEGSSAALSPDLAGSGRDEAKPTRRARSAARERRSRDILDEANRALREGDLASADALYVRAARTSKRGATAYAAWAAVAELRLRRTDDPAGAERAYRQALARPGHLDASLRYGLARALQAQGRDGQALEVMRELVERHPDSIQAKAVRAQMNGAEP